MKDLEEKVMAIEKRNQKVELDKKWETSLIRRSAITVLTYLVVTAYLIAIDKDQPFVNALVPAIGYFLSTLVLRNIRARWQKNKTKDKSQLKKSS